MSMSHGHPERRMLIVSDAESFIVSALQCFAACHFRVDCTRSFRGAEALVANVAYDAVVVHVSGADVATSRHFAKLVALLELAGHESVVFIPGARFPAAAREAMRHRVSACLPESTPIGDVVKVVRFLTLRTRADESGDRPSGAGSLRPGSGGWS